MDAEKSVEDPIIWFEWDQTLLNGVTIAALLVAPLWSASLIIRHESLSLWLIWAVMALLVGLCWLKKPCFAYDTRTQTFYSPEGDEIALQALERIDLKAKDIYFIPKTYGEGGVHLVAQTLFFSPAKQILLMAEAQGWPVDHSPSKVWPLKPWK